MKPGNTRRIVAFDFDDTLAETSSLIGARLNKTGVDFEEFLFDHNIQFVEFGDDFWWLDSGNYALLEDLTPPEGYEYKFDYAHTMRVDLATLKEIKPMLAKMQEALSDPKTLTLVVTARSGYSTVYSPSLQKEVKATNREQIMDFLDSQGLLIPESNLHTVGDTKGDTSKAKADVLASYLKHYEPEELVFYDDSDRNVRQVAQLCKRTSPHVKISAYRVANGIPTNKHGSNDKKGIKERIREILSCMTE